MKSQGFQVFRKTEDGWPMTDHSFCSRKQKPVGRPYQNRQVAEEMLALTRLTYPQDDVWIKELLKND